MTARLLRAPCAWFEKTPMGRVLNRFSSDMETLDKNLMDSLGAFVECSLNGLAVVVVVASQMYPLLVGLLPMLFLAGWISHAYLNCSRELKRLESTSRSPIYSHFAETVTGVSTVRAFGMQQQFVHESHTRADTYGRVNFYLWTANRWLAVRLQLLGALVTGMVGVYILLSLPQGTLSGSAAGLTLLYAMQFSSALNWLIRNQAELEMNMNATERTQAYTEIEQEAAEVNPHYRPPSASWPNNGQVLIDSLTLRYPSAPTTDVLKRVCVCIEPGTRVGVVGRTGAGKSSLLTALYRLVEPAEGSKVVIDGVDVLKLGLRELRGRLGERICLCVCVCVCVNACVF
jgi:ABC-type multidrug transport system fused ATPase/permease subunit